MRKRISRRRLLLTAGGVAGLVILAVPAGSAAQGPRPRPSPSNSAPGESRWEAPGEQPQARRAAGPYVAYVALAGGYTVAAIDVATHRIVANSIPTDAAQGVAVTPDGAKLYVADTGQFDVLVVDPATGAGRRLRVGPFPRSVAISPDGTKVYAAVTGGDTGKGGSDTVAVINARSDTVARSVRVGTAPRQVVFAADGARAYVTYDSGVAVLDARKDRVVRVIRDPAGPQGVAVDPAGRTLYVTEPRANTVAVLDAASGRVRGRIAVGDQPWGVAVTPNGAKAYVSRMNADAVAVIDTATRRIRRTVTAGRNPGTVAITPDGTEAWVGNVTSGNVSVISTASDSVIASISGSPGGRPLHAAPLGIAFARNAGEPPPAARSPGQVRPRADRQGPPAGPVGGRRRIADGHGDARPFAQGDGGWVVPPEVFAPARAEDAEDALPADAVGYGADAVPWVSPVGGVTAEPASKDALRGDGEEESGIRIEDIAPDLTPLIGTAPDLVVAALLPRSEALETYDRRMPYP
ncbi:YncE family protein [Actinoallomurus sp. NPDC052274]|uniref:YncE family protein n=1 Tax=Actinoallomurus sp. NPDC052274 TaxID=3155420 RepID=UPI00343CA665